MKKKKAFFGQEENEKIIKAMNRHPFVLAKSEISPAIIFLISVTIMTVCLFLKAEYLGYVFLVAFVVFLFSLVWAYYGYFVWSRDKYIITDQRVVDVEQNTFFSRSQREASLEKILPKLNHLKQTNFITPDVAVFFGWDGLSTVYEEELATIKKGSSVYIIGASKGKQEERFERFFSKYGKKAFLKNLNVNVIFNTQAREYVKNIENNLGKRYDKRFLAALKKNFGIR